MKNNIHIRAAGALLMACALGSGLWAQGFRDRAAGGSESSLPLKRVVILTSGLTYFEHSGTISGPAAFSLPFRLNAVNDALKSLVINDSASANPSIVYQSESTLYQTLRSLKIDLSDDPGLALILSRLKGAEVEIAAPTPYSGRIVGIEYRSSITPLQEASEPWLLLNTGQGLKLFNLKELSLISFKDPALNQDLNRALDLLQASGNSQSRQLLVTLPGSGSRKVSVSYVIPSPVWKVSYRLDLGAEKPLFQGWAIVDNDGDIDWNDVELSLVAGRPSSFVQNLYPPYYVYRPTLPLSIAGTAEAAAHDQGFMAYARNGIPRQETEKALSAPKASAMYDAVSEESYGSEYSRQRMAGGVVETAQGSAAGDQFEFTIKKPVSLDRQMSAMLPLVESSINGRKLVIFNGGSHPRLGAEITNVSGMKLPAGPITVYDGGVYAGDALIEFWNENEKRLISFGEDLSVTASVSDTNTRAVRSVVVSGGVMTISRSLTFTKTYTFKNSSALSKQLVVEHSKTPQTDLVSPSADEQTASIYRFTMNLPASREHVFAVNEQRPLSESVTLLSLRPDAFLSYSSNQEIPQRVRDALQRAIELRRAADAADVAVKDLEAQHSRLVADQERIRRNLEAAGSQTPQGQEYLKRLVSMDNEIDSLAPNLEKARANARAARKAWEDYLNALNL